MESGYGKKHGYVTGVTLEVRGMGMHASEPSSVVLELQCSSSGMMSHLTELLSHGPLAISAIASTEDKWFLLLQRRVEGADSRLTSFDVRVAELSGRLAVIALEDQPPSPKNGQ